MNILLSISLIQQTPSNNLQCVDKYYGIIIVCVALFFVDFVGSTEPIIEMSTIYNFSFKKRNCPLEELPKVHEHKNKWFHGIIIQDDSNMLQDKTTDIKMRAKVIV